MPTYITLAKWTQKGIENIKESPARLEATKEIIRANGGTLKGFYMVMGQYDIVLVTEGPDDEHAAKISLTGSSKGSVTTETLRAFTEEEYRKIIAAIP